MSLTEHGAPPHLLLFLEEHGIPARIVSPGLPMPTVASAAAAIGVPEERILKTLLFAADDGRHVVAIACGTKRIDRHRLAEVTGMTRLKPARPETVQSVTGYPAGGVAPVGLLPGLTVVVDSTVAALHEAYGGGGRENLLLRLDPADIIRVNDALIAPIVEGS